MAKKHTYDMFIQMVELNKSITRLKRKASKNRATRSYERVLEEKERKLDQLEEMMRSSA